MPDSKMQIRAARRDEAAELTAIAIRAKASWGYDAQFMERCRAELTVSPEHFDGLTFWAAELEGRLVGWAALSRDDGRFELEDLMVDPSIHGRGVGKALMGAVLAECARLGASEIFLDADPNAEAIYQKLGFKRVGLSPSGSISGRWLPRMVKRF